MNGAKKQRFQPEVELLLSIIREQTLINSSDNVSAFDSIDWNTVVRLASRHRLLPFVCQYQPDNDLVIPSEVQHELKKRSESLIRRNLYMVSELENLLAQLEEGGVRVLTYKGPTLAELAYGDITLREFADLDLLVPEQQFDNAIEILCAGNYVIENSFPTFGEVTLREQDTELVVDLHFRVTPDRYPFRFSFDRLWERRVTVSLWGNTVQTISPPDLLPVVAVHATKHFWVQLEWLVSFTSLIQHESIDLSEVLRCSRQIGCDRMVLLGLRLSQELLRLPLPDRVATIVDADRSVGLISRRVISRTVRQDMEYSQRPRLFHYERYLAQLCLMRGLRARAKYGFRIGRSWIDHTLIS